MKTVWVANADGTGQVKLTDRLIAYNGHKPTHEWSPDGSRIAYVTSGRAVWVADADGTGRVKLGAGLEFEWSPDGSRIIWGALEYGLWAANADGTGKVKLVDGMVGVFDAFGWSPDGSHIDVSIYDHPSQSWELWVMDTDDFDKVKLDNDIPIHSSSSGRWVWWSPDGSRIVYGINRYRDRQLWMANADGTSKAMFAKVEYVPSAFGCDCYWSPDSSYYAYLLYGDNVDRVNLWVVDAENGSSWKLADDIVRPFEWLTERSRFWDVPLPKQG